MAIITGTDGDDREPFELEGTDLADQIFGLAGNDTLVGFDGDDLLAGGAGADELFGSGGLDLASYRGSPASVRILLGNSSGVGAGGDATGDKLFSVEGAIGSAYGDLLAGDDLRNVLRGEGGADDLHGTGGNDRLEGGGGNDVLNGGAGDDELRGGAGGDTASFFYSDKMFGGAMLAGATIAGAGVVADLAGGTAQGAYHGSDRLAGVENLEGTLYDGRLAGDDVVPGEYLEVVVTRR
jgi:Ca2+-binding RTX toxin-like protein